MTSPAPVTGPASTSAENARRKVIVGSGINFAHGDGELAKQVLFDVALDVSAGEIVLMTGPSGSGKTTLLTLIGALRQLKHGALEVLGQNLLHATATQQVRVRRQIGFIFQQHNLLPFLTARQNVELSLSLDTSVTAEEARTRVREILHAVGLGDRMEHFPSQLSGGQKQRVAVARALAIRPRLILADEPTAALDSHTGRDVVNLLQKLAREQGSPILMVTHDSRVLDIADRIIHMEDGRIQPEDSRP